MLSSDESCQVFDDLGSEWELSDELFHGLDKCVYLLYSQPTCTNVNMDRYNLFKMGYSSESSLLPNSDSLRHHSTRACYQDAIHQRSLNQIMSAPNPINYGWQLKKGELSYVWMKQPPAPPNVMKTVTVDVSKLGIRINSAHIKEEIYLALRSNQKFKGAMSGAGVPLVLKVVPQQEYFDKLVKIGINIKAKNFLVFQGAVESIAMKNPKEITQLFEEISRSNELKTDYDAAKAEMLKAEEDTQFSYQKRRGIAAERKEAKMEKEEADRYRQLQDDMCLQKKKSVEETLKSKKKEHNKLTHDGAKIDQDIRKAEMELNKKRPRIHKGKRKNCPFTKKLEMTQLMTVNQTEIKELEVELQGIHQKQEEWESVLAEESQATSFGDRIGEEVQRSKERVTEINQDLESIMHELGDAKVDKHEDSRRRKKAEIVENFKRLFPGVYDRLLNMCQPVDKRYNIGITKVLGKNMEAIVVDSEKTARSCIQYLKDQMLDAETFLPLDYIDAKPLKERLRNIDQPTNVRLLYDVLRYDPPAIKRAVLFATNNALLCETAPNANTVAYDLGDGRRYDAVALDGTYYQKNGFISGGSVDLAKRARRWDEKSVHNLKHRKEAMTEELKECMKKTRKESELTTIQSQIRGLEMRLKYSVNDKDNTVSTDPMLNHSHVICISSVPLS
ncbi:Structural maintenance of chromosomes protein 1A [Nymphon striatum]|nr:Structural maintenance of chromosomes protein 1A [Nymphon striatum]